MAYCDALCSTNRTAASWLSLGVIELCAAAGVAGVAALQRRHGSPGAPHILGIAAALGLDAVFSVTYSTYAATWSSDWFVMYDLLLVGALACGFLTSRWRALKLRDAVADILLLVGCCFVYASLAMDYADYTCDAHTTRDWLAVGVSELLFGLGYIAFVFSAGVCVTSVPLAVRSARGPAPAPHSARAAVTKRARHRSGGVLAGAARGERRGAPQVYEPRVRAGPREHHLCHHGVWRLARELVCNHRHRASSSEHRVRGGVRRGVLGAARHEVNTSSARQTLAASPSSCRSSARVHVCVATVCQRDEAPHRTAPHRTAPRRARGAYRAPRLPAVSREPRTAPRGRRPRRGVPRGARTRGRPSAATVSEPSLRAMPPTLCARSRRRTARLVHA